jgi:ADP-heptose:LPS heptosyltransferase
MYIGKVSFMQYVDKQIKNIAVIMLGLMGDVLIRTPILRNLKIMFPDAKISAIVDKVGIEILRHNPHVDELILFHRNKNKLKNNIFKFYDIWQVRKREFDLLIDVYNGGSSKIVSLYSNAKYRLGFEHKLKGTYTSVFTDYLNEEKKHSYIINHNHLGAQILKILYPLEKTIDFDTRPTFIVQDQTLSNLQKQFSNINFKKIYLLNLGSGGLEKIMDFSKYFDMIEYIHRNYGLSPAIICNPGQEYLQNSFITDFMDSSNIPYTKLPALTIEEVGALMKLSTFIITPDTGLLHIAIALEIKSFAIFTYTNPELVDPKDENLIACFTPNLSNKRGDLYFGTREIPNDYLFAKIDTLLEGSPYASSKNSLQGE